MSIKLMSAIFETEFRPLPIDEDGKMAKASSLKLVLLAIADHANNEGESSYPGLKRLERKTGLSRQGLINIIEACKFNGLVLISDKPSKLGTNNYTLELSCYPCLRGEDGPLLVKPLDQGSKATVPPLVKPLDPNQSLTTNKSSLGAEKKNAPERTPKTIEEAIYAGKPVTKEMLDTERTQLEKAAHEWASLISMNNADIEPLAFGFMVTREVLPTSSDIKGWRKAFRQMREKGVQDNHVIEATAHLMNLRDKGGRPFTITKPQHILETAIGLANPAPRDSAVVNEDGMLYV